MAESYYKKGELYFFDALSTSKAELALRRPSCSTLYDVFRNIADDSKEHIKTISAMEKWCQGEAAPIDTLEEFYVGRGGLSMCGDDEKCRIQWLEFSQQYNSK